MIRTVVINQKGGVGKTTTTANLGAALTRQGKRVLLLDMDPQANLTLHLDRQPDLEARTMTNLLVDDAPLSDVIVKTSCEGLYMIPADTSLSGVEQILANRIGRETILREALEAYQGPPVFDHVLMDCPPSLGVLSANALVAGDDVIVPMQAEYLAMHGMAKLMEIVLLVRRRLNPDLKVSFILPCMVDQRTRLSSEVIQEIRDHFGDILAKTCIRSNVKLAEAPSFGHTIFEHAPDSHGAQDYLSFAAEFLASHQVTPAPAEQATVAETTADETTADETTVDETTVDEITVDETTADEATVDETTADEATVDETTADETTVDETTADEATVDETTADKTTVDETTADEITVNETTVEGITVEETAVLQVTVDEITVKEIAAEQAAVKRSTEAPVPAREDAAGAASD